jgi:serine/threonine-protein kinase RsbW
MHFSYFLRQVPSQLAAIEALSNEFAVWASGVGLPPRTIGVLSLMLDELMTNIIVHGYNGRSDETVELFVSAGDGVLTTQLTDYGPAFDPTQLAEPDITLDIDEREIGGLGVHFVKKMADDLHYVRTEHHGRPANCLKIVKRFEVE